MNLIQQAFGAQRDGMSFIYDARGLTLSDLLDFQVPYAEAKTILHLCDVYCSSTSYSVQQALASNNHHTFAELKLIETYAKRLPSRKLQWELRVLLTSVPARQLKRTAQEFVDQHVAPKDVESGISVSRHACGKSTLKLTGTAAQIEDMRTFIAENTAQDLDGAQQVAKFIDNVKSGGGGFGINTLGVIHLDDLLAGLSGADVDAKVRCGNGAEVDIAGLLERYCAEKGFVAVFDNQGPLQLFRESRFGNYAQRVMATAESTTCVNPGCRRPADECQLHHIKEWRNGGWTNSRNLAWLCQYCNSQNGKPGHGRAVRVNGKLGWIPPDGGKPQPVGTAC
ncbi:hypothetical protein CPHO_03115 [Corynebacterium phocae]|uniref:HNH nuclease domain-containing protein n=1 Tax=Corynebacterium phocae TaxID=161895 RepID=A0A1L7D1U7_9CORY|nr:HNH endonuclease signature motif containing protein [Corynebacterium phocae]APT92047.1 hypothetical protein CPHO_03115 [Corynebacterium phocae]KAA8726431.1 HNH endonuclease [Corynebacterium phocae]